MGVKLGSNKFKKGKRKYLRIFFAQTSNGVKQEIEKLIQKAVGAEVPNFSVEVPAGTAHGDYATNVVLALSKKLGKSPREVAQEIVAKIGHPKFIEKIEIAGPGFINFYLSREFFVEQLKGVDKNFGSSKHAKGWKVIIEHTQPNPFKLFHIGHLMNNAIGESVARIIKNHGAMVKTASYHGDVGLHVAKAVWALQKGSTMQEAYAAGHKAYEESDAVKEEILDINKKIYDKSDKTINTIFEKGRKESLVDFEKIYKKLDSKFDFHFYESNAGVVGKKLVSENVGKVFAKGEQGATIFEGEKFEPKTHTRVFLTAEGLPTYEGKEVGLASLKKVWKYDASLTVTANEQDSFFDVVEVAIGEVFPTIKGKMQHLAHGMLKLPDGKMSSRTGNIITAEAMIEQVKEKVREKAAGRNLEEAIIEQIAIGAIKYSILKQSIGSDIIFDFEKSISFEGDSGPYLQYSYVRAVSVLAKAKSEKVKASFKNAPAEISQFEKLMTRFPEAVEKAGKEYQPHYVATYLTELAHEFNNYYAHNKIVDRADEFSPYKVALAQAFSVIMKNGLWLLGIQVPEKM